MSEQHTITATAADAPARTIRSGQSPRPTTPRNPHAFSLVELLVVIGLISLLLAILLPALARARRQARQAVCASNLRQLAIANAGYTTENNDFLVPAASDIDAVGGGRHRWHGVRDSNGLNPADPHASRFDPLKGPLAAYLADGKVKQCPQFRPESLPHDPAPFELGTGGYGYNNRGVGSRTYLPGLSFHQQVVLAMKSTQLRRPGQTVMFTDAALPRAQPHQHLIEYSFAEAPLWVFDTGHGPQPIPGLFADPSIHFRHDHRTNTAWCDGHVSAETLSFTRPVNIYGGDNRRFEVGWFGPQDNSLFDPH
ncbi:MAG: prepilin-type N-terminal cleavage/methylation domain-containing protein [Phycisphaerae bacterium]